MMRARVPLLVASLLAVAAILVAFTVTVTSSTRETHVFLVAGQSNATPDRYVDESRPDPRIQRWYGGKLIPLDEHLSYLGSEFARAYVAAHPNVDVVLVDAAVGSTGFTTSSLTPTPPRHRAGDGTWDRTLTSDPANFYWKSIEYTESALAWIGGKGSLRGILWSQGEADIAPVDDGPAPTPAEYEASLDDLITNLRAELGDPNLPMLLGSMTPEFIAAGNPAEVAGVAAVVADTPNRLPFTAYFTGPDGLTLPDEPWHYSGEGQKVRGQRAFDVLDDAISNTLPSR
jgi:hypothetical protein